MLETLLAHLRAVAPDTVDVPILQPADPFLETAGENLRRRIFITESIDGHAHCLRPEFTIPICLTHVQTDSGQCRYAYGGTVFRQERAGASEFLQAGLEDIGNDDVVAADTASIADMVSTLAAAGIVNPAIVLGDQALFGVVVDNLQLPQAVAQRLVRSFGSDVQIGMLIDQLCSTDRLQNGAGEADRLALLGDESSLITHVENLMATANLAAHAGRSPADIAARMINKTMESQFQLDTRSAEILRKFLGMNTTLRDAPQALMGFAATSGIEFGQAGEHFFNRVSALQQLGVDLDHITYKASFGRNLEYYTGVLFEAEAGGVIVAGGGRYDRLCGLLGAKQPVPAVGFSISLDRMEEAK